MFESSCHREKNNLPSHNLEVGEPAMSQLTKEYIEHQLQEQGLRLATLNDSGWYLKVYDINEEIVTVWVTDITKNENN